MQRNLRLIRLMIREEYRMHAAMIGRSQFLFFPIVIAIFAFVISISAPTLVETMPMTRIYLLLHLVFMLYGLGIGGFALFGESIAERRFGQLHLLLETPMLQPVDFKSIFLVFYIKDVIYYILFSLVPIVLGIGLSAPITGFSISSILLLFISISLTFLLGISLSFFLSSLYVRFRWIFASVVIVLALLILGIFFTDLYTIEQLIPSLGFQYSRSIMDLMIALILIVTFSVFAVNFIKIEFGKRVERYRSNMMQTKTKFHFIGRYSHFVAKDYLDMKRSRTIFPILGAYIGPLLFLTIILWFLGDVLEININFNIVFYSAMIGFFGMTIYSWLNILDSPDFYELLPVAVPQLIKSKLILFAMLTAAFSNGFILCLGVLNHELELVYIALPVAFITTFYTVIATAYLTGLRTNVYLFDPNVLGRFVGAVALPLIVLTIGSFMIDKYYVTALILISVLCVILALAMLLMLKGIDKRWSGETFAFA